ncbi:hypothetical protein IW261DRAFT_1424376 [Armillaria novae-zelandiae]|uniref:Uncharacterized protein n=1 Tax=Armillaria novae-zelandiae TaxID=153914 RepID=A0AA39U1J6_9AGAR|nr:hypothetical protein IW261DRAFT_1424376 [Armillaria novae-zelandiae]
MNRPLSWGAMSRCFPDKLAHPYSSHSIVLSPPLDFNEVEELAIGALNTTKLCDTTATPGFDPIIGQAGNAGIRMLSGTDPADANDELTLTEEFVVSRGGEYFFTPSINSLKETFARPIEDAIVSWGGLRSE